MRLSLYDDADAIEPLTLDDAKVQIKLPVGEVHPDDDLLETILIPAVRERAELATNRQLRVVTWDLLLDDGFPSCGYLELPKPPLIEVESITYVDASGVTQTWADDQYVVYAPLGQKPPRGLITLAYGVSWPTTRIQPYAITVRFRAGYWTYPGLPPLPTTQQGFPPLLKAAMLLDLGALYAQRENVITGTIVTTVPLGVEHIYRSFKSWATQPLEVAS